MMLSLIGGFAVFVMLQHYGKQLPTLEKLQNYQPDTATRLYAGDGKLLVEYATEKRVFVPLSAIPKQVQQAFLSAEDKNFYQHAGVDFQGIARAVVTNFNNIGKNAPLVGASTITQQVVKNFLLTNEQSFERKIKEALLAFRISKVMSKDTVLELYLNDIYLGGGAYGVAGAALHYFNKSMDELTLEESAFLAALPKAPNNYNPQRRYEAAKSRRDWVISRMQEDGYIDAVQAKEATDKPIVTADQDATEFANAAYFAEEVRRKIVAMYGGAVLYGGGLTVHTTVDPVLQRYATRALRKAMIAYDRRHGFRGPVARVDIATWREELLKFTEKTPLPLISDQRLAVVLQVNDADARVGFSNGLDARIPFVDMKWASSSAKKPADIIGVGNVIVTAPVEVKEGEPKPETETYELAQIPAVNGAFMAMDPHTGRVLAMVGGYSAQDSEFNRATQARRQPGSAFKPFVYLTALQNGFTPSTLVMDTPLSLSQGPGLPLWQPKNYGGDFLGPTTLRRGLEQSRNVMTVRLALQVGIERILNTAYGFGIYDKLPPNFSIVLGSSETTMDRLVNAYAMLVNGGKRVQPSLIERIQDRNGKTIFRRDNRACEGCTASDDLVPLSQTPPLPADAREQVVDPRVAYQMVSILEGVVLRGTGTSAKVLGRPVAGKTGTTNDSRDAWFVGFTPDLVAGVYIGYDTPRKLGAKETGGKAALPAFIDFMGNALKDKPALPFRIPNGIRLTRMDVQTGQPPGPGSAPKNIIFEAFKIDQEPGSMPVLDVTTPIFDPVQPDPTLLPAPGEGGENLPAVPPPSPVSPDMITPEPTPSVSGTGGLY